ncbi:MAG: metalloregulator ArsR/SmtB family transcription factor [Algisphaera sp.]
MPSVTPPDMMLRWLATLADASRVRLLRLVEGEELGVSDLCAVVQMPQSTVSRHLKLLGDEGWLTHRRVATTHRYRMVLDELEAGQRELWVLTRKQMASWATLAQDDVRLAARLAEKTDDAEAFFADAAADWDRTRHTLYGAGFSREALLALVPETWTVADLGCGTGSLACDLGPVVDQVIGVDNSPAMLEAARAQTRGLDNVTIKQGELTALPLEDASCDATLCVLVLTYLDDPAAAVAEMARVLRPGGRAVVLDLLLHDREDFRRGLGQRLLGFEPSALESLFAQAGLMNPCARPLRPDPQATGPALLLATATKPAKAAKA